MARSDRRDGIATRKKILRVALPLFARRGYAGTSIRAISSAADCNVATIAYHFGGKEGLYEEVSQHLHLELAQVIPKMPPELTPEDMLGWWMNQAWLFCKAHRIQIQLLSRHVLDRGELPQVAVAHAMPLLGQAEQLISLVQPTWPSWKRRMLVLTMQHATVRFMLEDPAQLAQMAQIGVDEVDEVVVTYLTDLVKTQLGLL